MTSQEIFRQVNAQQMFQQEQARKLQEAKTGISKQMIVSGAIQQNQMMAPQQPMGQTTNPNGWGRTS